MKAKEHVLKFYPLVGILEHLEESLSLADKLLPEFVVGIGRKFKGKQVS